MKNEKNDQSRSDQSATTTADQRDEQVAVTRHTAGPWSAAPSFQTQWLIAAENEYVANTLGGNDEANARVISAAPDMLVALKLVDQTGFTRAAWVQCQRAIAKAEGRS